MSYSFKNDVESVKFVIDRLSINRHLSDWEKNFIKSIKEQFADNSSLSTRQSEILSDLWEKY